jgi:hypothetical protein
MNLSVSELIKIEFLGVPFNSRWPEKMWVAGKPENAYRLIADIMRSGNCDNSRPPSAIEMTGAHTEHMEWEAAVSFCKSR